ncbi:MAG: alkaline phosphatase D family protein [Planctomycetota bacterium]
MSLGMRSGWMLVGVVVSACGVACAGDANRGVLDVIAFGSCAREYQPQPVWEDIVAHDPDLFLFIGDNQYADLHPEGDRRVMKPVTDIRRIEEAYADLAAQPGWALINEQCPVLATWDDHDFGKNDGGAEYPLKAESQRVFMDFYGVPADHPMRSREGVYQAQMFGPEGRRVQVILLDTRYHRDAIERNPAGRVNGLGPYMPTTDASRTMLGEAQWAWLGEQLEQPADVRIIASSVQVIADEHGWETWGNMPHERRRLYELIDEKDASGVVFLSGDRHLMEISRHAAGVDGAPYAMWDFTSSGMTEAGERVVRDPNSDRVGPVRRTLNYGLVTIDWGESATGGDTEIALEGRGFDGELLTRQSVWLSALRER